MRKRYKELFHSRGYIDDKHIKKYSTSLAIRKVQIKAMISYHHIPIRIGETKNSGNTKSGNDSEKLDHFILLVAMQNSHSREHFGNFFKNQICKYHSPGHSYMKTNIHTENCMQISAVLYVMAQTVNNSHVLQGCAYKLCNFINMGCYSTTKRNRLLI